MHLKTVTSKTRFDNKLEGLRGLCAIVVAVYHVFGFNFFGASKTPLFSPITHLQFGHIAVLIFFIISGYVIGKSHFNAVISFTTVKLYLKKRFIRLYPIYLVALAISIILGPFLFTTPQIVGHFFFMQEFLVKTISSNVVLWSLSYEVVYYLAFVGIWTVYKITNNLLLIFSLIGIFVLTAIVFSPDAIRSLLVGWLFWLIGLCISTLKNTSITKKTNKNTILSYFLILLATQHLQSGGFFIGLLNIISETPNQISLTDLIYIPICTLIVIEIACISLKYINLLRIVVFAIPAINILVLLYFKHPIFGRENWAYGTVFFGLSILLLMIKTSPYSFEKISFTGRISYAIYIFHFPIGFFLSIYLSNFLTGMPLFITGLFLWMILTISLSYLAEIKFQPYIKKLLIQK